jgi:FAD/FMN-containing dehydrogenase
VKVEAGAVMENLNSILQDNNMAFSVLGSISDQTIGGKIT